MTIQIKHTDCAYLTSTLCVAATSRFIIGALLDLFKVPPWLVWTLDVEGGSTSMFDEDVWFMLLMERSSGQHFSAG